MKMSKFKEKAGKFLSVMTMPTLILGALAAVGYASKDEPREGEFKRLNKNEIKTLVYCQIPGAREETYNFENDRVKQRNVAVFPRRGIIDVTKNMPFSELHDTTGLHIARQMQENGYSFAKKMHETIIEPHTIKRIIDNKDTLDTETYNTYKDSSYVAFKR